MDPSSVSFQASGYPIFYHAHQQPCCDDPQFSSPQKPITLGAQNSE